MSGIWKWAAGFLILCIVFPPAVHLLGWWIDVSTQWVDDHLRKP